MVARHQGIVKRDDRIVGCDQRAVDEDDVTARAALVIVQPVALGRIDLMLGEGARIWRRSVRACFGGIAQYCGVFEVHPHPCSRKRANLTPQPTFRRGPCRNRRIRGTPRPR
jgi:hypothetical protein